MFAGIGAFEFGNCAATLLILCATELLQPDRGKDSATTIALALYVTYNAAVTVTSLAAGPHSDRTNATRVLIVGVAAFGIAYLGFTNDTTNRQVLLPWFLIAGVGIGCVETAEHTAIATTPKLASAALRSDCSRRRRASATSSPASPPASCGPSSALRGRSPTW